MLMWSLISLEARPIASCGVIDLAHRRVYRVHRDVADGQVFVEIAVGGNVSASVLDAHFELQLPALIDRGDIDGLVKHGEIRVFLDHGAGDDARIFDVHENRLGLVVIELQRHLFQIQNDVRRVFHYAGNGGKFVQDAFDLDGRDGRALNRAQQSPAKGIAHGRAPATLEWLSGKFSKLVRERLKFCR